MSTALTSIFGSEISVTPQPPDFDQSYTGFAGAHGMTAMNHGSRGRNLIVTGKLSAAGGSYAAARTALLTLINTISTYRNVAEASYTYQSDTYNYVIFTPVFKLQVDKYGRFAHWNGSDAYCFFTCVLRQLVC